MTGFVGVDLTSQRCHKPLESAPARPVFSLRTFDGDAVALTYKDRLSAGVASNGERLTATGRGEAKAKLLPPAIAVVALSRNIEADIFDRLSFESNRFSDRAKRVGIWRQSDVLARRAGGQSGNLVISSLIDLPPLPGAAQRIH